MENGTYLISPEMQNCSTEGPTYQIADFEGPLDLLLFLIKKNEVSIFDIPIATITDQFINAIRFSIKADLGMLTEFYMLASTLLFIKSRMLLPVEINLDEEIDDPREDLVEKLIEYQKFKRLSSMIEEKEREIEWIIERKKSQRPLPFCEEDVWQRIDVWDLLKAFSKLIGSISSERIIDMYEEVSINEKITLIHELLEAKHRFSFHDLITRPGSTLDIVCAFLAMLEAVKYRIVAIRQHRLFGDIEIVCYDSVFKKEIL